MNNTQRHAIGPQTSSEPDPKPLWGEVIAMTSQTEALIDTQTGTRRALVATHIPVVIEGQRVLLMSHRAGKFPDLIVAAYPLQSDADSVAPFVYDASTGALRIRGVSLTLVGEQEVAIECGSSSFVVTHDGSVKTRGERILSAAVEVNRIEGGSIEFN
ncbi:hypothetical protein SDC9_72597 [bioreactor metagenome]|uniref:Gp5/Type VI secretion system Vgr protein OB-fold domain-containing protein n=1 Tax=bioreactor metagenome TaxID=1076179 RepID=A0A644YC04_9ZZZZ